MALGMLVVGLWPFRRPRNDVTWITSSDGLSLGHHGTFLSSSRFDLRDSKSQAPCSLEIWLQPYDIEKEGSVLAFYSPDSLQAFSLREEEADLVLELKSRNAQHRAINSGSVENLFRRQSAAFVTVSSGSSGTEVYLDGLLIKTLPWFKITSADLTGRLVVGTSPVQNDDWSGQLKGLAIYRRRLDGKEVFQHYRAWKTTGRPYSAQDARALALYLFDEHSGDVVCNHGSSTVELYIPSRYTILDEKFLEPFWKEFNLRWGYWKSALINIGGFVPFGFLCCAYLSLTKPVNRAAVATVVLGLTISLTIEVLQSFLPTRDSGTTDLITNTLGTGLGVVIYRWKPSMVPAILNRIPLSL